MSSSAIHLFLSIDIYGSTKLKGAHNYSTILEKCISESRTVNKFLDKKDDEIGPNDIYELNRDIKLYQDWSKVITDLFSDFNTCFNKFLAIEEERYPWKFLGDELIYCFEVKSEKEVYDYTLAFYKTLRSIDSKYIETKLIRLKGSAWTAGFPVRNRIIETPIPKLYMKDATGQYKEFLYPHNDYIGPEMDIGFRIGKNTYPGFIVISLELAYILLNKTITDSPIDEFRVYNVGWEPLKGVWQDKKYPVLWLQLPDTYDKSKEFYYPLYKFWDREENHLLKNYDKAINGDKTIPIKSQETITDMISELNQSITNIIVPYFATSEADIPSEHKTLLQFIKFIKSLEEVSSEDSDNSVADTVNDVKQLLEKRK